MSYKNKTYIIFDAGNDMIQYRLMTAWKKNEKIDFNFHNAHDIYSVNKNHMDRLRAHDKKEGTSREETYIKGKLKERLTNTKQVLVLVGDSTKDLYKYVRWEIEVAINMDIPIIAVNL
jgi:2-hydroxy-3-keto-5-methylthiopentenyl-1-phosphate phosphatase